MFEIKTSSDRELSPVSLPASLRARLRDLCFAHEGVEVAPLKFARVCHGGRAHAVGALELIEKNASIKVGFEREQHAHQVTHRADAHEELRTGDARRNIL